MSTQWKQWFRKTENKKQDDLIEQEVDTGSRTLATEFQEAPEERCPTPVEHTRTESQPESSPVRSTGFMGRLRAGLGKTRASLLGGVDRLTHGRKAIDEALLDELEELLITSDLGARTAGELIRAIEKRVSRKQLLDPKALRLALQEEIQRLLRVDAPPLQLTSRPSVILVVGVNGTGKTTTIGKLAHTFRTQGKNVMLVAGDTFRAAAVEQLETWAQRTQCSIVKQRSGSDPGAVVYDGIEASLARGSDIVIVDTAGRLQTQKNLMEELRKIKRVIGAKLPGAPHEVLLILDATTGQNALSQARLFQEAAGVTGLVLTKLDGTAKGGIAAAVVQQTQIPLRYIGIGESLEDLKEFDPEAFAQALFVE